MVAGIALVVLVYVSSLLWMEVKKRFPLIPEGSYLGSMSKVLEGEEENVSFYAERLNATDLLIAVLREGWIPEEVKLVTGDPDGEYVFPIVIQGERDRLRFIGREIEPGLYGGVVTNLKTGDEGRWRLKPIESGLDNLPMEQREGLRQWLTLRTELNYVENRLARLEVVLPEQRQEIDRISTVINEGEELREEGDLKYRAAQGRLKKLETQLAKKHEEAAGLQAKVNLAHKVTKMGRLVTLAREAAERDNRWVDSMLRSGSREFSTELLTAIRRGEQISEMQEKIRKEELRIMQLQGGGLS